MIEHEHIAVRAYLLWEWCGKPEGYDLLFWLMAEEMEKAHQPPKRYGLSPRR